MKPLNTAPFFLMLTALFWGLTFPVIKAHAPSVAPELFVTTRFILAALIILPFVNFKLLTNKPVLKAGAILGLLNCCVYLLQTYAIGELSAARCAFLTGTVVLWVPLLRRMMLGSALSTTYVTCGLLCLIGLWILTGANFNDITSADGVMLIAEGFFAFSLIYLDKIKFESATVNALTFYQIMFTGLISALFCGVTRPSFSPLFNPHILSTIIFCAIFATVLSLYFQVKYQRKVGSEFAALIFATEPLWAAACSTLFFNELLNVNLIFGGILITLSVMLPELLQISLKKNNI